MITAFLIAVGLLIVIWGCGDLFPRVLDRLDNLRLSRRPETRRPAPVDPTVDLSEAVRHIGTRLHEPPEAFQDLRPPKLGYGPPSAGPGLPR